MDIAFVSGNPHLPQLVGGVEVNTHVLAEELARRGHRVAVLAKLSLRGRFGLCRAAGTALSGRPWIDCRLGYPVYRSRRPAEDAGALPRPDIAVVQNGEMPALAAGFARAGVPAIAYLHGLSFETWSDPGPFRGYIANSRFTAARFRRRFGIAAAVVPPLFRREDYAAPPGGRLVTLVNPVAEKGLDLAWRIAALCPDIRFCFVRAWRLGLAAEAQLARNRRRCGNVELRPRTSDMRTVYRDTRILLVPSQVDETWGRVVSEAQISGIPAVASNRGGLPEAVGPGGIVLDRDAPAELWAAAVRALWSDAAHYDALGEAALRHSHRSELDPEHQLGVLLAALSAAAGAAKSRISAAGARSL